MTYSSTSSFIKLHWGRKMDLIIGGGKYGCQAIEYLRRMKRSFLVVDINPNCLALKRFSVKSFSSFNAGEEAFIIGGLPEVLELIDDLKPEYVFPTAPLHIAAELVKIKFELIPWPEAINTILPKLPEIVVINAGRGNLVVSFNRDRDCIENCAMPKVCPSSQIKKPCTMTELMRFACPEAFLLVSHSMAPGLGALKSSELSELFKWAKTKQRLIVATSCDCHGVFSALKKQNKT